MEKKKKKKIVAKKIVAKKKSRKKRGKAIAVRLIDMEDVYRILNRVQLNKKEATFSVSWPTASIVKNVVKDLGLDYVMKELKSRVTFVIHPTWEEPGEEMVDIELFEDEIIEDGQLF